MKKIALTLAAVIGFGFLMGSTHAAERSNVRREFSAASKVTQAQVVQLNNKVGRASCVIYPDAEGEYPSISDIATNGQAGDDKDKCGGCPKGKYCHHDEENDKYECRDYGITLPPNTGDPL